MTRSYVCSSDQSARSAARNRVRDAVPASAAARAARMRLLSDWAKDRGLDAVVLGHTQDDQAETLLMRLARGAGVDGLSGMAAARSQAGALWLRPMLGVRRDALRGWLTGRGIGWADDPTNEDEGFDRIRVRRAIAAHLGRGRQAAAHRRPRGLAKDPAALVGAELCAAHAGGLAVRHAGNGAGDGRRRAASAAAGAASQHSTAVSHGFRCYPNHSCQRLSVVRWRHI